MPHRTSSFRSYRPAHPNLSLSGARPEECRSPQIGESSKAGPPTCGSSLHTTAPNGDSEPLEWLRTPPASLSPTKEEWGEVVGRHEVVSKVHAQMRPPPRVDHPEVTERTIEGSGSCKEVYVLWICRWPHTSYCSPQAAPQPRKWNIHEHLDVQGHTSSAISANKCC